MNTDHTDQNPPQVWIAWRSLAISCLLSVLCVSVVSIASTNTTETRSARSSESDLFGELGTFEDSVQDRGLDYSKFLHSSPKHSSLSCTACHERADNAATPRFAGHKACTGCHLSQFVTPAVPMCEICHSDVRSSNPPLRNFPARFNERFNVKFDHAQHMAAGVRPRHGCAACHGGSLLRGAALSIPAGVNAHNGCYSCHTPGSKSLAGRDIASCGVCHDQKSYTRTPTTSPAFRFAFSHAKHGPRQGLGCNDCHSVTAGAPQMRQVSSPTATEHFPTGRMNCLTCHNGRREFGGDLAFKDCRKCHTRETFR